MADLFISFLLYLLFVVDRFTTPGKTALSYATIHKPRR
jgi:hypothetical protein